MKKLLCVWMTWPLLAWSESGAAESGKADISNPIREKAALLLEHLRGAGPGSDYGLDAYFRELDELGKAAKADAGLMTSLAAGEENAEDAILALAAGLQDPQETKRVDELKTWYGRPAQEIPFALLSEFQEAHPNARVSVPNMRKGGPTKQSTGVDIYPLFVEHTKPEYFRAWEAWLMAPSRGAGGFVRVRVFEALPSYRNPASIPLLSEKYKIEMGKMGPNFGPEQARSLTSRYLDMIRAMPGEKALDAMLEIQRVSIARGFVGEGRKSISRQVARCLSSYHAFADTLADPVIAKRLAEDSSRPLEKPEDVPRVDDLWKAYKPLVASRLQAVNEKTPPEDVAVLKTAMELMPKD